MSPLVEQPPRGVRLAPGEEHVLRLPARGSGGYDWHPSFEGPDDVVAVTRSSAPLARGAAGAPPRTASTDTLVQLRALRPGRTAVVLEHRRPHAAGGEPLERLRVDVEVIAP